SGCHLLEDIVEKTLNQNLSVSEYKDALQEYIKGEQSAAAAGEFKQCFLNQSKETLTNFGVMMQIIYNSIWCKLF
ncbi:mammaglobin-B precursor, partial [Daubentonia madagascariensis]